MIPKRRKAPKLGVREAPQIRSAGHCQWIRGHWCVIDHATACRGGIECVHVRPGDNWTIPLCNYHRAVQQSIGERAFEKQYLIDLKKIAAALWAKSPHRHKSEIQP